MARARAGAIRPSRDGIDGASAAAASRRIGGALRASRIDVQPGTAERSRTASSTTAPNIGRPSTRPRSASCRPSVRRRQRSVGAEEQVLHTIHGRSSDDVAVARCEGPLDEIVYGHRLIGGDPVARAPRRRQHVGQGAVGRHHRTRGRRPLRQGQRVGPGHDRAAGFTPLPLARLHELLGLDTLSDTDMMRRAVAARLDPGGAATVGRVAAARAAATPRRAAQPRRRHRHPDQPRRRRRPWSARCSAIGWSVSRT